MNTPSPDHFSRAEGRANQMQKWILVGFVLLLSALVMLRPDPVPRGDATRYIKMGLNLLHHGVVSRSDFDAVTSPEPSLLSAGPFIAVELALVSILDPASHETFLCVARGQPPGGSCSASLTGLKLIHLLELAVVFAMLWLIGRRFFDNAFAAWLLCFLALVARETTDFSVQAISEPGYLALYMLFAYAFIRLADFEPPLRLAFFSGLFLGLVPLAKPAAAPLVLVAPLIILVHAAIAGRAMSNALVNSLVLAAAALLILGPWIARNWQVAGVIGLADPFYLASVLAQRVAYNAMSWKEWWIGWIYYLPDFGDQAAKALFQRSDYVRLGWGEESLYIYGKHHYLAQVQAITDPLPATGYIIKTKILAWPFKHIAVSALLFWRGIFLSNYWGLSAVLLLPFALIAMQAEKRWLLAYLAVPALAIAGVHSLISVSIPRYNIALIPVYAIVLTWFIIAIGKRLGVSAQLFAGAQKNE